MSLKDNIWPIVSVIVSVALSSCLYLEPLVRRNHLLQRITDWIRLVAEYSDSGTHTWLPIVPVNFICDTVYFKTLDLGRNDSSERSLKTIRNITK